MKKIIYLFLAIFLISLVSSNGFIIETQNINIIPNARNQSFNFNVINSSNGVPITSGISCSFNLYNNLGENLYSNDNVSNFNIFIDGGNFTNNGIYSSIYVCNSTTQGGSTVEQFEVTTTGMLITAGQSILMFTLVFVLLIILLISINSIFNSVNPLWLILSSILSYFVLLILIFVLWQLTENYLGELSWIVILFNTLFIITLIMMFPFIIGLFVYLFVQIFNEKNMTHLSSMGYSSEDAKRMNRR
jgi:hypothetical protein